MKSVLRSTAILGSSSLVSIIVGLFSAKAWAILLGPGGLGFVGLLQSLLTLNGMVAGMGIGTGLVRMGANALAHDDHDEILALYRAAKYLVFCFTCITISILIVFRYQISSWMLGDAKYYQHVIWLGVALFFATFTGIQTSLLNAHHKINALATIGVVNSILGTGISLLFVWIWGEKGITPGIIANAAMIFFVSRYLMDSQKLFKNQSKIVNQNKILPSMKKLINFGTPYTLSMFIGTGVQLIIPAMVLHLLDKDSVGYYRAAITISVNYLGFLLTSMGQDYYPRVSAVSDEIGKLNEVVNQQFRLVFLLSMPLILFVMSLSKYIIPIIYSNKFNPAVNILEWQLVGDIFKFSSWTLAFVILSHGSSVIYFFTEAAAGIISVISAFISINYLGVEGLGVSFLITYIIYLSIVWFITKFIYGIIINKTNTTTLLISIFIIFLLKTSKVILSEEISLLLGIIFTVIYSFYSVLSIIKINKKDPAIKTP